MLILFDHGTPKGLIRTLAGHDIITAQSRGWDKLNNEALRNAGGAALRRLLYLFARDDAIRLLGAG